jgi:hypothetical protein
MPSPSSAGNLSRLISSSVSHLDILLQPSLSAGASPRPVWQPPPGELTQKLLAATSLRRRIPSFGGIVATRFLLGLFTDPCLPPFSLITAQWYRRSEQPIRVATWYSTNGIATMFAAILSYGLGHIQSKSFHAWQVIFIFVGLITCLTSPFVYWLLDSNITSARFLNEEEKTMAVERLRANQTGIGSNEFKWTQVWEMLYDPKSYLFLAMSLLLNIGAAFTTVFGPTLIANFSYDNYLSSCSTCPSAVCLDPHDLVRCSQVEIQGPHPRCIHGPRRRRSRYSLCRRHLLPLPSAGGSSRLLPSCLPLWW